VQSGQIRHDNNAGRSGHADDRYNFGDISAGVLRVALLGAIGHAGNYWRNDMLTLADAIRAGCTSTTQCSGDYVVTESINGETVFRSACALGAAAIGLGLQDITPMYLGLAFDGRFPELYAITLACPDCGYDSELWYVITHLNDEHAWTREAIADFIDGLTLDLTPVAAAVEVTA
jgi:hypothetical protein